ncbi:EAL domain-containing protein (putative c-di-GMP-specific phosphodiesterase class I) [Iodobacter fluviatilis]|uniref:Bacteriophytochrome cph2 n=2 Tax=Iodobacter fluviatilis TaxID=537 RepID=A0A377Q6R0_9NEIS|nr:EAL domain-containing protein (putative c-di-GMP-specific phosphodiesterase class I) [Iodobacter fluviatilis]STQ90966.1 Bacteriophytochrome cph2 [Iodobacter fluviatilis]
MIMPFELNVFIVEDSLIQRMHAAALCTELGLRVMGEASDGNEALLLLQNSPLPDVMLIDLEMPGMDGIELIQELAHREIAVSVIVSSAKEDALISSVETMLQAYGLPVLGAIKKPLTLPQLSKALDHFKPISKESPQSRPEVVMAASEITKALVEHQFIAYFQPKISIKTGVIKGVETLIRWQHPEKGLVMPSQFISIAEEQGLINELTMEILDLALQQCRHWHERGLKITVAINLSMLSLSNSTFAEHIAQKVASYAIDPSFIVLEITETAVMGDVGNALGTLARLRLKGFGLSIDDYGTGFSSMQQLSRIPFTELKLDRSFVDGAHAKPHLRAILASAIEIAKKLDLRSVAEGVECVEDLAVLQELGCDIVQGYLTAKPMPGDEIVPWLKSNNQRLRELCKTTP